MLGFVLFLLVACQPQPREVTPSLAPFDRELPTHFPAFPSTPDNPMTQQGVELGRRLFYDKRLSGNNQISCASCHEPAQAFSDGVAFTTVGVSGRPLDRNSPALLNLAWMNNGLFWEGGATNLESQAFAPLTNLDEMAQDLVELETELKADPTYVQAFKRVFDGEIKVAYVARALAQFQRSLLSYQSAYDAYVEKKQALSSAQRRGLALFTTHCSRCHQGALFTDNLFHNNGLDDDFSDDSKEGVYQGRFRITRNPVDLGKYKTPTLRNIALTAPYMHDGRFPTLEAVLKHYATGVKASPSTDAVLTQNRSVRLSESEQQDIIHFLNSLTDYSFTTNPRLQNPF